MYDLFLRLYFCAPGCFIRHILCTSSVGARCVVALEFQDLDGILIHHGIPHAQLTYLHIAARKIYLHLISFQSRVYSNLASKLRPLRINTSPTGSPLSLRTSQFPIPISFGAFFTPRPPPPIIKLPGR